MKTLASVILFFLLVTPTVADDLIVTQPDDLPGIIEAARGCCSHHGGMSGQCQNGRVVCRDGSISPSCKCRADSDNQEDNG